MQKYRKRGTKRKQKQKNQGVPHTKIQQKQK